MFYKQLMEKKIKTISIKILTLFIFFFIATALLAALVVGAGAAFVHGDQSKKMTTAECLADETCHEGKKYRQGFPICSLSPGCRW
jgi:hypothetical protein